MASEETISPRRSSEEIQAELDTILEEKAWIHANKDLWDPYWGNKWEELEERECQLYAEMTERAPTPPPLPSSPPPEDEERWARTKEQVEAELAMARANYRSALMSDPNVRGWDRICSNFEDEVDALERELEELLAEEAVAPPVSAAIAAAE